MSKHTPGPWAVDESRHDGCINRIEPFRHIGMASGYQVNPGDREENEANARLMAAAPDLLEALEQARKYVAFAFDQGIEGAEKTGLDLDAAIAKARGES